MTFSSLSIKMGNLVYYKDIRILRVKKGKKK